MRLMRTFCCLLALFWTCSMAFAIPATEMFTFENGWLVGSASTGEASFAEINWDLVNLNNTAVRYDFDFSLFDWVPALPGITPNADVSGFNQALHYIASGILQFQFSKSPDLVQVSAGLVDGGALLINEPIVDNSLVFNLSNFSNNVPFSNLQDGLFVSNADSFDTDLFLLSADLTVDIQDLTTVVPEPGTIALLSSGLLGVGLLVRRRLA